MLGSTYKFIARALARTLKTPPYIILFVSDTCWAHCRHCWYHGGWKKRNAGGRPLDLDEIERLARSIRRVSFLSLAGGEAFLREDVAEIIAAFIRNTNLRRYQIPTSGFDTGLVVEKTENLLRRNGSIPFRVDVSLDGTERTHDAIRRRDGCYRNTVQTIRELNRLRSRYSNFDVAVITTLSAFNQSEVNAIGEVVREIHGSGEWIINIVRGSPRDSASSDVDPESYVKAHRLVDRRIRAGDYRGHGGHGSAPWLSAKNATRRKVIVNVINNRGRVPRCAAGTLAGVILLDGTVLPCELIERPLGNLRDFDLDLAALWNSPGADKFRNWVQENGCACTQECFLSTSLLINPQFWPDIARERLKLLLAAIGRRSNR